MGGEDSVLVLLRNHKQLNLAPDHKCAANNVFNDMRAENCALRRCSVCTLVRMSSHINCATNIRMRTELHWRSLHASIFSLEGTVVRTEENVKEPKHCRNAAAQHTRALAQWMRAPVSDSRATGPWTLAWPRQILSGTSLLKFVAERKIHKRLPSRLLRTISVGRVEFCSKAACGKPPMGDAPKLHEKQSGMRGRPWRDVWGLWLCSEITSYCLERGR